MTSSWFGPERETGRDHRPRPASINTPNYPQISRKLKLSARRLCLGRTVAAAIAMLALPRARLVLPAGILAIRVLAGTVPILPLPVGAMALGAMAFRTLVLLRPA